MWTSLLRILNFASYASIGYFINDFGAWIAGVTGTESKVKDSSGGFRWWYVLIVAVIIAAIIYFVFWLLNQLVPVKRRKK